MHKLLDYKDGLIESVRIGPLHLDYDSGDKRLTKLLNTMFESLKTVLSGGEMKFLGFMRKILKRKPKERQHVVRYPILQLDSEEAFAFFILTHPSLVAAILFCREPGSIAQYIFYKRYYESQ